MPFDACTCITIKQLWQYSSIPHDHFSLSPLVWFILNWHNRETHARKLMKKANSKTAKTCESIEVSNREAVLWDCIN